MADESAPVASAVIVPSPTTSPTGKRRRSSAADSTTKRPRLSDDEKPPLSKADSSLSPDRPQPSSKTRSHEPSQERRKASIQEERKRGQRLFGGLLSTLSQTTPNGQNKRRQEIERKQQERAKLQKATDEERKREKLANLRTVRLAEQIKFEEKSMKTRHVNLRAMANFLRTTTGPTLYYKPWELLPEQEDRIKQQKSEAAALIEDEKQGFYNRNKHLKRKTSEDVSNGGDTTERELVGEANVKSPRPPSPVSATIDIDTTNSPSIVKASPLRPKSAATQDEQNGDILVENDEDAVIY